MGDSRAFDGDTDVEAENRDASGDPSRSSLQRGLERLDVVSLFD